MTIEQRFKYAGLSFYLALAITLLSTDSGLKLIQGLQIRNDFYEVVVTIVGFGLVFFTSESIGYLLNAIFILYWNVRRGYSGEWRKLSYDFEKELTKRYKSIGNSGIKQPSNQDMEESRKNYGSDVILSYFWQQAPTPLVQWVSRRHTVFFSNMTSAISIVLALLLSTLLITMLGMGWMTGTTIAFGAFIVLAVMFYYNAQPGRIEARQLIDMWMHRAFDPTMGRAIQDIEKFLSPSTAEKVSSAKSLFKVMRVNDVKARNAKNDQRLYYYDKDAIDVVSTIISKKYVEPSHLHTLTTESYYVVTGRLLLNVEGQSIWLNEGDLAVVSPGACHNFETDGEEVKFLAIKKETGLKDKQAC